MSTRQIYIFWKFDWTWKWQITVKQISFGLLVIFLHILLQKTEASSSTEFCSVRFHSLISWTFETLKKPVKSGNHFSKNCYIVYKWLMICILTDIYSWNALLPWKVENVDCSTADLMNLQRMLRITCLCDGCVMANHTVFALLGPLLVLLLFVVVLLFKQLNEAILVWIFIMSWTWMFLTLGDVSRDILSSTRPTIKHQVNDMIYTHTNMASFNCLVNSGIDHGNSAQPHHPLVLYISIGMWSFHKLLH